MTQQLEVPSDDREFRLPDRQQVEYDLQAIHAFQALLQNQLKDGHDYGVIPGTGNKATLLKPGAEKITKLLGLAEQYEILASTEDWDKPLFRYLVRCRLVAIRTGQEITQGLGECNSMESKYRWRWLFQSQLPASAKPNELVSRTIRTRNGSAKQYRLENDDIYSQVNTIVKMAKKRALVDAALSVGRLSDLFTQDLEEMREQPAEPQDSPSEASAPAGQPVKAQTPPSDAASRTSATLGDYESRLNALFAKAQADFGMDVVAVNTVAKAHNIELSDTATDLRALWELLKAAQAKQ